MSKDKCLSIFSRQMEATVFTILQIFFPNTRGFENWGILTSVLTEREGRTGEYWPEVVTVRTERK